MKFKPHERNAQIANTALDPVCGAGQWLAKIKQKLLFLLRVSAKSELILPSNYMSPLNDWLTVVYEDPSICFRGLISTWLQESIGIVFTRYILNLGMR